jgi:hypothetical protein
MNVEPSLATLQQRLARNRQAMLAQMRGRNDTEAQDAAGSEDPEHTEAVERATGTWGLLQRAARAWWQSHPARFVAHMAEPALNDFARAEPLKLVGIAAGVGAAAIVLKPWRLMSLGAVLAVALRPVDLSSLVLALVSQKGTSPAKAKNG